MLQRLFICVFLILPTITLSAKTPAQSLSDVLGNMNTFQATFTQVVQNNDGSILQTSSGSVAIKRPNDFRWQVDKPMQQISVANGKKMWLYQPDLAQVVIRPLDRNLAKTPMLLLTHPEADLQQQFTITMTQKAGLAWYHLTPTASEPLFQSLWVGFQKNALFAMRLVNNLGQTTLIRFYAVKINQPLSNTLFHLQWDKDTDIVDMTR